MTGLVHVTRGSPIGPAMRAPTWNAFIDAAVANRMRGGQKPDPRGGGIGHFVRVANNSGSTVARGDILGIDGVEISPDANDQFEWRPILDGVTPTSSHHGKFVIAAQSIHAGEIGKAHIDGMAVVKIADLTKPWQFADIDTTDGTQLVLAPNGSAQVLYTVSTTNVSGVVTTHGGDLVETAGGVLVATIAGEEIGTEGAHTLVTHGADTLTDHQNYNWALVRLGLHRQVVYRGVTDEEITYDDSGTVSLWTEGGDSGDNVEAELDWMHGNENVSSGKEVLVKWFPTESLWRITGAECED